MTPNESRLLPNAADKAALKAIATRVIQTCPSLQDTAHEVAGDLLKTHGLTKLDPDKVYFHRFDAAQSSSKAFTGWEHVNAKPTSTMTLTQLVIHRFRATDQDNADLLDVYAGFYSAGPSAGTFNETNEVRLHGNEVLKDFWSIDFSSLYIERLNSYWNKSGNDFRTLAKCNFLIHAVQARDRRQLSDDDFQLVTNAVMGTVTWPVSLEFLQTRHPGSDKVRTLDVDGYVANNILRFVAPKGRQIVYLPGETEAFQVLETATDMHYWMLQRLNTDDVRQAFMTHFPLAVRQKITENITDLMNRLVSTWGKYDHSLINKKNAVVSGDAFAWMSESSKSAMFAEADLSLTSNGDLRKKLWIGYLSAGVKVFGPMAVVGWPIALPVVGASIASMGLNIDQAVNGKTAEERKAGILGAVLNGIDLLFNLLVLKGPGSLEEAGPEIDAAEAKETADLKESTLPTDDPLPTPGEATVEAQPEPTTQVPDNFKIDVALNDDMLVRDPGKFEGTYQLASNPSSAIKLNGDAYYVRYETNVNGRSSWAIVDPANPDAFSGSIPVRLGANGKWEIIPRLGLRGGMEVPVATTGTSGEPVVDEWARPPGIHLPGLEDPAMRAWSLGGPDELGLFRRMWTIGSIDVRSVLGSDVDTAGARSEFMSPVDELTESMSEFDLAQEEPRRILVSNAKAYYELNPASLDQAASTARSVESTSELLDTVYADNKGLVVGEARGSVGSKQFLIKNMQALAQRGVKTLYLQELLANVNQLDLDTFARTGEMPEELENYLRKLDFRAGNDPDGQFNLLNLVKTANAQRIRVQAIDISTTYNINKIAGDWEGSYAMARSFFASEVIQFNEETKGVANWVALVNQENMATFRGFQGISEQTGAVSLRIDDVVPGQAQAIGSDPGLPVEYADYPDSPVHEAWPEGNLDEEQGLIRGDWHLQAESQWAYRSPQALQTLLPEPGMFTFQRYRSSVLVVYRNADNQIVDSVIRPTPEGRLNLDTPLRPAYESITVDNLAELKAALITRGMKPMGWPQVMGEIEGAIAAIERIASELVDIQRPVVPDHWQANELLEGGTPQSAPGKFQGIYQLNANPSTAIMMDDTAYYVRYEADINGSGHWAIIDPANPESFSNSIPVRLNSEGQWETVPRGGLKGGGRPIGIAGSSTSATASGTTPLPDSPYEIPRDLRPQLEDAAAGHERYGLRDQYESPNEFSAFRTFKSLRKQLYQDAVHFYEKPNVPVRPPVPALAATSTADEIINGVFEDARGMVIGESHDAIGSKQFLIENMERLAQKNVKTLYMEHLMTDFHQAALNSFSETKVMPRELEEALSELDRGHMTDPLGRYTFLNVVKTAAKYKIRVQAIDCMASYRVEGMELKSLLNQPEDNTARQKMMNYFARSIIRADQALHGAHKWVALMGNSHSNTFEGIAGVSELEEGIGIRVEDVAEGASGGIEVDPGKILPLGDSVEDRAALVRGDLRMQIETPWHANTLTEFEALLPRSGMYSLKRQPLATFLMHRSRGNELVRTLIETDAGRYYVNRPNWPSISGKRYDSIKALLQALNDMGLRLAGWSKPL